MISCLVECIIGEILCVKLHLIMSFEQHKEWLNISTLACSVSVSQLQGTYLLLQEHSSAMKLSLKYT